MASGEHVVEIDPQFIEPSFISDRLREPHSNALDELRESIADRGQIIPILVRPIPQRAGFYQVAFGHRRLEVLRGLGRPVKAIIRHLSDEELVVAQGKENLERRDLSFIERSLFASRLEDRGFDRAALMAALAVHKSNLSTMIAIVRAIPEELITSIGPAPKVGRPRWEQMAALLRGGAVDWRTHIATDRFLSLGSDSRFECVLTAVKPKRDVRSKSYINDHDGQIVAEIVQAKNCVKLSIDENATSSFGSYLIDKLPDLYAAFKRRRDE